MELEEFHSTPENTKMFRIYNFTSLMAPTQNAVYQKMYKIPNFMLVMSFMVIYRQA